jgi:hypothetical protein
MSDRQQFVTAAGEAAVSPARALLEPAGIAKSVRYGCPP